MASLYIITTEQCQMKCPFCYTKFINDFNQIGKDDSLIDTDTAVKVINIGYKKDGRTEPFEYVIFHGGEPLLVPEKILDIIDRVDNKNIKYGIQTNLDYKQLSQKQIEVLQRIGSYGTSYSYDRFLGQEQSALNMIKNIKLLNSLGIKGSLLVTVTEAQYNNQNPWSLNKFIKENMPGIESVILERPIFPIDEIDKDPAKYENIYNEVDKFMYQSLDAFDLDFCDVYGRFRDSIINQRPFYPIKCSEFTLTLYKNKLKYGCPSLEAKNDKIDNDFNKISNRCIRCKYYKHCGGDCECMNHICAFPKRTFERVREMIK